jgi:hypothetical protein
MAYRGFNPPTMAFQDGLSSLRARIRALNKRIKWPGAVQSSFPDDVNVSEDVDTLLASITLDPGRWLVAGGTSFTNPDAQGPGYRAYCSIVGGPFDATVGGIGPTTRSANTTDGLTVFSTGVISSETVVELRGTWGVFGASIYPTCVATRIFLIATPA